MTGVGEGVVLLLLLVKSAGWCFDGVFGWVERWWAKESWRKD
jgi:hypothetical protein